MSSPPGAPADLRSTGRRAHDRRSPTARSARFSRCDPSRARGFSVLRPHTAARHALRKSWQPSRRSRPSRLRRGDRAPEGARSARAPFVGGAATAAPRCAFRRRASRARERPSTRGGRAAARSTSTPSSTSAGTRPCSWSTSPLVRAPGCPWKACTTSTSASSSSEEGAKARNEHAPRTCARTSSSWSPAAASGAERGRTKAARATRAVYTLTTILPRGCPSPICRSASPIASSG